MKKNKKLKGMTLVECIVALAVLTVFTTGMATAVAGVSKLKVDTNNIIKKNSYQSNWADNRSDLNMEHLDAFNYTVNVKWVQGDTVIATETMSARKNVAKVIKTDEYGNQVFEYEKDERNYQYYDNLVTPSKDPIELP